METVKEETATELRIKFRAFCDEYIAPYANDFDAAQAIPVELIGKLAEKGYLGASIPVHYGGKGWSQQVLGILNEEIGKGCSSVRSLLTVHLSLVSETICRWGSEEQKEKWLPDLATGKKIAAFGLTEPETGSDAKNIGSSFKETEQGYVIQGVKKWITFGQIADVFLVFARNDRGISAFILEKDNPGLQIITIKGVVGTRASMLSELRINNCFVSSISLLGKQDWGFSQIANTALDNGRFSVATGSLGIAGACLEHSLKYAASRKQFGSFLKDHQLIKQKIARMTANVKAASLLCRDAAIERDNGNPNALIKTSIAKFFASQIANEAASDALQIFGASGFHESSNVQRFFRDAKVMEIIEGSTEIQQIVISDHAVADLESIMN
jgi:glutaryl-CoA dehydrogenase (non-decarboxylating)